MNCTLDLYFRLGSFFHKMGEVLRDNIINKKPEGSEKAVMQTLCPFLLSVFIFSKMQGEYPQYKVSLVEFSHGGLKVIT